MSYESDSDGDYVKVKRGGKRRACLGCKLIKTLDQFQNGCDNCGEEMYDTYGDPEHWTTPSFIGMIALMDTRKSWVAKYQRIVHCKPGIYAITVKGTLDHKENHID